MSEWVAVPDWSDFTIDNLPYGLFRTSAGDAHTALRGRRLHTGVFLVDGQPSQAMKARALGGAQP